MLPAWLTDTVTTDLDRAVHYTLLWGLEGVELRTVGGLSERVPFVNEARLKRRLAAAELPVCAIVPGVFEGPVSDRVAWLNDLAVLEETCTFCHRVGCPLVVVSAFAAEAVVDRSLVAEALRRAGRTAARHRLNLAVLNEAGMAHPTGAAVAALLAAVDHPAVGAAWHPAAAWQSGEVPRVGLETLGRRVLLVRAADGRREAGEWVPQPLGQGEIGWQEQLSLLHVAGFEGPVSLEVHILPRPKTGLHDAAWLINTWRSLERSGHVEHASKPSIG
jgi:sugar phosphate isomerase/epimerase